VAIEAAVAAVQTVAAAAEHADFVRILNQQFIQIRVNSID